MIELILYIFVVVVIIIVPVVLTFLQWRILEMEGTWTDCHPEDTPKYQENE